MRSFLVRMACNTSIMTDVTSRILRLLTLLQSHRHWSGPELATTLNVTERTIRRDVDRLGTGLTRSQEVMAATA